MPPIVYVETSFLMSYATGRDLATNNLSRQVMERQCPAELAIPSVCFMEVLSTFETMRKGQRRFMAEFRDKFRDCERSVVWADREDRLKHLAKAAVEVTSTWDRFASRLGVIIGRMARDARMIEASAETLELSMNQRLIDDSTDNLILTTILNDAAHRSGARVLTLLTENSNDFHANLEVRKALSQAGIRYFARADDCLGWLNSLPADPSS